jgi:hypothetical protein
LQNNRVWNAMRIGVWAVAGLVVVLAVVLAATVVALPGCSACHQSPAFVSQTQAGAHATLACVRCHASSGVPHRVAYAYNLLFGQTLHVAPVSGGPITAVPDSTCLSCHGDVLQKKVTLHGLSILHSECSKGRMCTDCHADTAHGTAVKWIETANMNQCLDCHNTDRVRSDCNICHAQKSEQDRIRSGEWAITHGPSWRKTHGMGDLDSCAACHPRDYCVRCHGISLPHDVSFIHTHPQVATVNRKDCAVCHQQAFCTSCHGLEMPHTTRFTAGHSTLVKAEGSVKCMRCHIQDDCTNCHVKHVHPGGATGPPQDGVR